MIKPSSEIKVIGSLLIIYPFFRILQYFMLVGTAGINLILEPLILCGMLINIAFFGMMGWGIIRRLRKMRMLVIVIMLAGVISPFLGIYLDYFIMGDG